MGAKSFAGNRVCVEYDHQVFSIQAAGGISNSFARIVHGFRSNDFGIQAELRLLLTRNRHLGELGLSRLPRVGAFRGAGRLCKAVNSVYSKISRFHGEIVHATYYTEGLLPSYSTRRLVSTVHDMIPEASPQYFPGKNPHAGKRKYVEQSDLVVCVSQTTRDALCAMWPVSPGKCVVVPHFVGPEWMDAGPIPSAREQYVLFVGLRGLYKRFDLLLKALSKLPRDTAHVNLVVAGAPLTSEERAAIGDLCLVGRVRQVSPTDSELRQLYARALCLVFPSEAEGFGIPILEAFASLCPVIATDIPVFREIGEDAVCYFPAGNAASLSDRISELARNPSFAGELAAAGRVRLNAYSARNALEILARAYKGLVS